MDAMARAFWLGLERSDMFIRVFTRDLEGPEWRRRPPGAPNCALWHLGHVAHQRGRFLELLTGRDHCEPGWGALFDLGAAPCPVDELPDVEDCHRVLSARLADLKAWLEGAGMEDLEAPPAVLSDFFPTRAAALTHLSHHEAHHTGCMSMLRRQVGRDKVV